MNGICIVGPCIWHDWQEGECSKSCGGGTRTNTRKPSIDAKHGGDDCPGSSIVTESCNVQECPGIKRGPIYTIF